MADRAVALYVGNALAAYGFPDQHPFAPGRHDAFWREVQRRGLDRRVQIRTPVQASRAAIERFHSAAYVERVIQASNDGVGYLDAGDTPAFVGIYEASATVVGSTIDAVDAVMSGSAQRAFVPIAGLHHASRDSAAGFCVFNDCGVAIESLRSQHGVRRVLYVDIDAHHGDGVYYAFADDPDVLIADLHEDGRFLYPGTGFAHETGRGPAAGSKLNLPLLPLADDDRFFKVWASIEEFLADRPFDFVLFQCGADSLRHDPLTQLHFTAQAHAHAASRLCEIADARCQGRIVALGGGGYDLANIAAGWCAVLEAFVA
ncbi:MAG: acetoin utilization protein AcuC [Deltaproteobacteria bacterium]|nr:acetoin utilization protein AcuC [Deltaproteobacteria bacterium]